MQWQLQQLLAIFYRQSSSISGFAAVDAVEVRQVQLAWIAVSAWNLTQPWLPELLFPTGHSIYDF